MDSKDTSKFWQSAAGIARAVRHKKISAPEVVEFHLQKISASNKQLNALRFVDEQGARQRASQLQKKLQQSSECSGRLTGVVFCAKDSINVKGMPRSDGTLHQASTNEASDCALIERLCAEGAICIGKGNMAEYGKSYATDNLAFGRTNNPFRPEFSAGGSGGGDAAAVASLFASFGIGADAGGSIRVPANFCGLYGLHATHGAFSTYGLTHPSNSFTQLFRSHGPVTRSLKDLELIFNILNCPDPRDPYSLHFPALEWPLYRKPSRKFAFYSQINGIVCDKEITQSLHKTVRDLEAAGYRAEEHTPQTFAASFEIFIILAGQASLYLEDCLERLQGHPRDETQESASIQTLRHKIATRLPELTVERLLTCWHTLDVLRHRVCETFDNYDFVLAPVAACTPPLHGSTIYQVDQQSLESQQVFQFASCANLLNLPAIAFPTQLGSNKLPLGLQIIGPRYSERQLFNTLREIDPAPDFRL